MVPYYSYSTTLTPSDRPSNPPGQTWCRAHHRTPCLPYLPSPQLRSRLYLAHRSAPHSCIQPYLGTAEPRDLAAWSRCSPEKHWPTPLPCDSRQPSPLHRLEHAVAEQLCLARVKLCYQMSQNVYATWRADVTAPLANSPPKSRLALAVEPPDQPPRYPRFDRIHPQGSLILTAASRPFGSACISAPERVVTLDNLNCVEISVRLRADRQQIPSPNFN